MPDRVFCWILWQLATAAMAAWVAVPARAARPSGASFRPGEKVVLKGRTLYVEKLDSGKQIVTAPVPPAQSVNTDYSGGLCHFMEHAAKPTLVMRRMAIGFQGAEAYHASGTAWILGYKTEGGGTLLATTHGGRSEVLGGLSHTVGKSLPEPMFLIDNAAAGITFPEVCYNGKRFAPIACQARGGVTKKLPRADPRWGGNLTLFTAGGP